MKRLTIKRQNGTYTLKTASAIPFAISKLGRYEDAEENGTLFRLPCKIGDPIFVIPTITNFRLNNLNGFEENNRVYKQIICNFVFTKYGCTINTCEGFCHVRGDDYGKTWFLTREAAEQALQHYRRANNEND